jgi:hypothetical protein
MKRVLIITSHFPPSNLAGVHRGRLFAKYLPNYGWDPIVLTVDEKFYEEKLDYDLNLFVPTSLHIEKVSAFNNSNPRTIGDIGIRAFFQMLKKANGLIKQYPIDFIYIIIPSFYLSLLGPILFRKHGIKYGIDYMDPWVHDFPGTEKMFSRHWWSTIFSKILEPIALKNVSLLTTVAPKYIEPIFSRTKNFQKTAIKTLSLPMGWDSDEKKIVVNNSKKIEKLSNSRKLILVYAGAFLPKSLQGLSLFFKIIQRNSEIFEDVEFHFIGTGEILKMKGGVTIKDIAVKMKIYEETVFEHPDRIPYIDVLSHISSSNGIFIIGSSESHYTPSKLFSAFIMQKPVFALLHEHSTAKNILEKTQWGEVCDYFGNDYAPFEKQVIDKFLIWKQKTRNNTWNFDYGAADQYSIQSITYKLANIFDDILQ